MLSRLLVGFVIKSHRKDTCDSDSGLYFDSIWDCKVAYDKLFSGYIDLKGFYFGSK